MSSQGIIVILLSVIGFLIVSWVGIAGMWIKDKLHDHDERIDALEDWREKNFVQNTKILNALEDLKDVG